MGVNLTNKCSKGVGLAAGQLGLDSCPPKKVSRAAGVGGRQAAMALAARLRSGDGLTGRYSESVGSFGHSGLLSPDLSRNRKLTHFASAGSGLRIGRLAFPGGGVTWSGHDPSAADRHAVPLRGLRRISKRQVMVAVLRSVAATEQD